MKSILEGLRGIAQAMVDIMDPNYEVQRERHQKILRESKKREQWFHRGPWYTHPLWGDTWKDKK